MDDIGNPTKVTKSERHLVNDAIRTQWSENITDEDEKIISVDELDDLTGLVLPKSVKFDIDEVRLRGKTDTGIKTGGKVILALPDTALPDITHVEPGQMEVVPTGKAKKKEKIRTIKTKGFLKALKPEVQTYDITLHGPLVDTRMEPAPGREEIELYPVNAPYAYIRISFDHGTHEYLYEVLEPVLSLAEADLFRN